MPTIGYHQQLLEDYEIARDITGTLRDVSAIELKRLRDRFDRNDRFYKELGELYRLISRIARKEGRGELVQSKGETLHVAFTSNHHFYGSLNRTVIERFLHATSPDSTCLIIGETGRTLWKRVGKKRREVRFAQFKDDTPTDDEMRAFLATSKSYYHVLVYYPGFTSVMRQDAAVLDITFSSKDEVQSKTEEDRDDDMRYILEPEIVNMFPFFDMQVRYVLFARLLLETELSRVSARLVRMDEAEDNAKTLARREQRTVRRERMGEMSARMLNTFNGFLQWQKFSH